jgi:hypothetical protein
MTAQRHVPARRRIDADPESVDRGLVSLVLTIVELLRQLMERQALRRVDLNLDLGPLGPLLPQE